MINIDYKNNIILTVRKQFVLNLEVLLLRGDLHLFTLHVATDYIDCIAKKSYFIGLVNKLKVTYGKITSYSFIITIAI